MQKVVTYQFNCDNDAAPIVQCFMPLTVRAQFLKKTIQKEFYYGTKSVTRFERSEICPF